MKKHISDIVCVSCFALLLIWGALFPPISSAGIETHQSDTCKHYIEIGDCRVSLRFLELFG